MITINPPILMKKTKTKPSKQIKKITVAKDSVKKKVKKQVKKVKSVKKPTITIDIVFPKKEKKVTVKSLSNIEVPRTIRPDQIINKNDELEQEESAFDINGERKKRRGRNKKEKIYFSKKTEDAIIEYNAEEDEAKRNFIYENKIKFSFEKLVENIFNTFKFTYFDNSPIEIQKETVSHLVTNIHKFQAGKGKAFSYFSIVATNAAKAWVHFNGTGNVGINANYNVSSITDNGTGDYTVNFTSAFVDTNYVVAGTATIDYTTAQSLNQLVLAVARQTGAQSTGSCRLATEYIHGAALYDAVAVRAVFYR